MGFGIKTKLKRRNSEKRKEKSRDAARTRRSKETEIFLNLSKEIPVTSILLSQMDKASIIRLAITHLKIRNFCERVLERKKSSQTFPSAELENKLSKLYYKAVDGFLMVISDTGNLIYTTENIMVYLGLPQVELLGHSIFDFVHPCDHSELRDLCGVSRSGLPDDVMTGLSSISVAPSPTRFIPCSQDGRMRRDFFMRMKCILPCKGRSSSVKTNAYKVIHCSGSLISCPSQIADQSARDFPEDVSFLVIECESISHPSQQGIKLDYRSFMSQHTMDMKFIYCDDGIGTLLGYSADQLVGTCLYEFHHALDNNAVICAYRTLFSKGQSSTGLYRFLAKNGGYAWVETQASLVNNPQTDKPQSVICISHVVSDVLDSEEVLGLVQQKHLRPPPTAKSTNIVDLSDNIPNLKQNSHESRNNEECLYGNFGITETFHDGVKGEEADVVEIDDVALCDDGSNVMFATERIFNSAKTSNDDREIDGLEKEMQPYFDALHSCDVRNRKAESELPSVSSNASLFKLLKEFDDDGDELRAPFIPMDDLIFVNDTSNGPLLSPVEVHHLPFFATEPVGSDDASVPVDSTNSSLALSSLSRGKCDSDISVLNQSSDFSSKSNTPFNRNGNEESQIIIKEDGEAQSSSVLRNLLLKGEDTNYGYHLMTDFLTVQHKEIILGNGPPSKVSTLYQLLCS